MGRLCSSFGCSNTDLPMKRTENVTFHAFPLKHRHILKQWYAKMKRDHFTATRYSRLCSEHFSEEDFEFQPFTNRRQLKQGAVPSRFSFNVCKTSSKRPRTSYVFGASVPDPFMETPSSSADASSQTEMTVKELDNLLQKLQKQDEDIKHLQSFINDNPFSFHKFNTQHISNLTGFSKEHVLMLFDYFRLNEDLKDSKKPSSLSKINQFFLTLIRLRQGFTERALSAIFHLSVCSINHIFNKVILIVYMKASKIQIWPSREQVNAYMPPAFHNFFQTCRVIIDTTEFYIHKPGNPTKQQASFSTYKNHNTLKSLIGMAPNGSISFISNLWLGSISDKDITKKSGILELLEEGDTVLADRGFTVLEPELEKRKISLFTPYFLKDKIQFPLNERSDNKRVSSHRCHVERAIGRIKQFKILSGVIPSSLKNLEEIYYVCVFLTNFSKTPLINVETLT